MCDSVQQGHFSSKHQGYFCLPPRYLNGQQHDVKKESQDWVGTTGCQIKGIVSAADAQWQIVLHDDVITHQQPICQEARYRKEVTPYNPRCGARGACGLRSRGLQRCCLAPPMRQRSKTHQYHRRSLCRYRLADAAWHTHHCGAPVQCHVNGLMYVVFSSHRTPMKGGRVRLHFAFSILHSTLDFRGKDRSKLPP